MMWLLVAALGPLVIGCSREPLTKPTGSETGSANDDKSDNDGSDGRDDADADDDDTNDDSTAPTSKPDAGKPRDSGAPSNGGKLDAGRTGAPDAATAPVQSADAQTPVASGDAGGSASGASFPPAGDLSKDGPYKSMTLKNSGPDGKYSVYLPTELAPGGAKNPIVGWMSGGNTMPSAYPLLPRLATHGFVVVAANVTPSIGQEVALGKNIIDGIEWAIAEATKEGSMFFGKLDTTKTASIGYSMGALASFTIADNPKITTTVHISGGNMDATRVNLLKQPALFICGEPGNDIAAANCDKDFMNAKTPVFYANFDGGHLGIQSAPTQAPIYTLATSWLRWKLMSDATLDDMFVEPACTVCKDKTWLKVQQKK